MPQLVANSEFMNWIPVRHTPSERSFSSRLSYEAPAFTPSSQSDAGQASIESYDYDETPTPVELPQEETTPTKEEPTPAEPPSLTPQLEAEPTMKEKGKEPEAKEQTTVPTKAEDPTQPTFFQPEEMIHLVVDISLAAACGYQLHKKGNTGKKYHDFFVNLRREVNFKCHSTKGYQQHPPAPLDHPISLARELTQIHHIDQLKAWEKEATILPRTIDCILSDPNFTFESKTTDQNELIKCLFNYAKGELTNSKFPPEIQSMLTSQVQSKLQKQGFPHAYHWLNTFKPSTLPPTQAPKRPPPTVTEAAVTAESSKTKGPHVCPAIREETDHALTTGLPECLNKLMSESPSVSFNVPPDISLNELLTKVMTEIVKHNSNWNLQSFTIKTRHLSEALYYANIKMSDKDQSYLLWTLAALISKLKSFEPYRKPN